MSEGTVHATAVAGAEYCEIARITTASGAVLHMLRPDLPLLPGRVRKDGPAFEVGEIYFSEVLPGVVNAWKRHSRQTQHFAVPAGRLGLVLYDGRDDSPTRGAVQTLVLGRQDSYVLVRIPCGVWYGFRALGESPALICNAPDMPHDPAEGTRIDPESPEARAVPFDWKKPFPGAD